MFGVKLEEPVEQLPASPRRSARSSAPVGDGSPKKMFFGVEVADESPGPLLDLPEVDEGTNPSISTVSAVTSSRVTLLLLLVALGALSAAAWELGQLSSAHKSIAARTAELDGATAKVEDLTTQVGLLRKKVSSLEDDKSKLTEQLAVKTNAYDELAAKAAKSKASRGKSKAKRHGRKSAS